jgi:hypothetical protein
MPWVLVVALVGAVAYALGSSRAPAEHISAATLPPLSDDQAGSAEENEDEGDEGLAMDQARGEGTVEGVVREHQDVSQYTYLRLATDAGETWAAVYRAPVKDGDRVSVQHATAIHKFHSRELARDFDTIWFGMLPGYEAAPAASGASGTKGPKAAKSATPAGAISVADLAKKASSLEGTQVKVAGKVVKENDGIMGRNWIHIQDGTGSADDKSNDLLITTDDKSKVGDSIVAVGTVRTKQDFGSGYAYEVLVEKASVRTEPH